MINQKPLLVGITGGIGAGKTTVSKFFSILNVPVYYADDRAKWLMQNNPQLKKEIQSHFGAASYFEDGSLNRQFLAQQVFGDEKKTSLINALVHPVVGKDFTLWAKEQHKPYVLKEAALLFETGSYKTLDKTINVTAPKSVRIDRVMTRDPNRNKEQVLQIIQKQLPDNVKNGLADYIVKNYSHHMVIPQVLMIHEELLSQAR